MLTSISPALSGINSISVAAPKGWSLCSRCRLRNTSSGCRQLPGLKRPHRVIVAVSNRSRGSHSRTASVHHGNAGEQFATTAAAATSGIATESMQQEAKDREPDAQRVTEAIIKGQDADPQAVTATEAANGGVGSSAQAAPALQQAGVSAEGSTALPQTSEQQTMPGPTLKAQTLAAPSLATDGVAKMADADASRKGAEVATTATGAGGAAAQPAADVAEADGAAAGTVAQPLSKNQQKKLRKAERRQELKAQRKAEEKAQKAALQDTRRAEAKARLEGMTEEEKATARAEKAARLESRRQQAADKKARQEQALVSGQRLVVDLDFEGLMTPAELASICNQLMHSYSANSRAATPCHLHFTSVTGAIQQQIQRQLAGFDKWKVTRSSESYLDVFAGERQRLVYLTADADTELAQVDPQDVYIIGGLVDRNRHKNICWQRAEQQGIRTARLPISGRVQLTSSTVLTVNQVVEIMLEYLNTSDWGAALEKVIPARKRGGGCGNEGGEDGSGDAKRARTE